jgi:hypothetical protein
MSASFPPSVINGVYNPNNYSGSGLTMNQAKTLFALRPNTDGSAQASKALVLNASGGVSGITSIDCSVYKQNGIIYDLSSFGATISSFPSVAGVGEASKALVLNSSSNITSGVGSFTAGTLVASSTLTVQGIDVRSNILPLVGITLGTPAASKVLSLNSSGILNGNISQTGSLTSSGTITSNTMIKASVAASGRTFESTAGSSSCIGYHYLNSDFWFGTTSPNKLIFQTNNVQCMTMNADSSITGISSLSATTIDAATYKEGGISYSLASLASGGGVLGTAGVVTASKGLLVDGSSNIRFPAGDSTSNTLRFGGSSSPTLMYHNTNGLCVYNSYFNFSGSLLIARSQGTYGDFKIALNANQASQFTSLESYGCDLKINSGSGKLIIDSGSKTLFGTNTSNSAGNSALMRLNVLESGSSVGMRFGSDTSVNNCMTMQWSYAGSGSGSNKLQFDPYGSSNALVIQCDGKIGVGTATPSCPLHVPNTTSVTLAAGGQTIYYMQTNVATTANLGIGPQSFNISAIFGGAIQTVGIYTTSDRRLKTDIQSFDISDENYLKFEPVSFKYKSETNKTDIGLIAQDVAKIEGCLINVCESQNAHKETDEDLEGYMLSVDYSKLAVINLSIIKKLLRRLELIETYSPLQKHLSKMSI